MCVQLSVEVRSNIRFGCSKNITLGFGLVEMNLVTTGTRTKLKQTNPLYFYNNPLYLGCVFFLFNTLFFYLITVGNIATFTKNISHQVTPLGKRRHPLVELSSVLSCEECEHSSRHGSDWDNLTGNTSFC